MWERFSYDALDRRIEVHYEDNTSYRTIFSGSNTTTVTPAGKLKTVLSSTLGVIQIIDGLNNVLEYDLDVTGRITSIHLPTGFAINITRDSRGRIAAIDHFDWGRVEYQYDVFGNLIRSKTANGDIIEQTYDSLNRIHTRVVFRDEGE